ncbi:UPF0729 protein C18orf32 homolog [Branchiostoma floridae x Branchiostoma japonicum]|uniref:CR032 protein n=1 Tax=Branchiostoma floridae TaxID=7739 RepID=C3XXW6_BRAFL|eukprot:XP_002611010.1 hypothetical protein BRAFLDRAFT_283542 [Branchiostoma floridae]
MVCISCIVIPVLLWVYHRFLKPVLDPLLSKLLPGVFSSSQAIKPVQESESPQKCPLANGHAAGPAEKKEQ